MADEKKDPLARLKARRDARKAEKEAGKAFADEGKRKAKPEDEVGDQAKKAFAATSAASKSGSLTDHNTALAAHRTAAVMARSEGRHADAAQHEKLSTDALTVALDASKHLTLSGKAVTSEQLKKALALAVAADPGQPVTISADRSLPYGEVASLLDDIRAAGVRKVGLEVVRK